MKNFPIKKPVELSGEDLKCAEEIRLALLYYSNDKPFVEKLTNWFDNHIQSKPVEWSKDDKKVLEAIIDVLINNTQAGSDGCAVYKAYIDWLKSLKDTVQPPSMQEWSEEDEKIAKELIRYLPYCDDIAKSTKDRWISWLERQCEQKPTDNAELNFMEKKPKTTKEAIAILDKELSQEDKNFLIDNGAISVHHSLGRWIRNNWGLW